MIARIESILRLTPLFRRLRERVETNEIPLEDSVKALAYASELVVMKLRWLLPSAQLAAEDAGEGPEGEGLGGDGFGGAEDLTGATAVPFMESWEVLAAVTAIQERMRASARKLPRGDAPVFEGGRRLEVVKIEPTDLRDAMLAALRRSGAVTRTYVVSRWSFVTHLRDFWREVRRLTAKGAVLRFSRFLGKSKQEAILNFLAFLELVKRRRLFARQKSLFGDIEFTTMKGIPDQEERR